MINKIITLDDLVKRDKQRNVQSWLLWKCNEALAAKKISIIWDGKSIDGEAVMAFINHGRWLARCKICNNPSYVSWQTKIFYCVECGNGGSTSAWPVAFPEEREEIETALLMRKVVVNPNKYVRNEVEAAFNATPVILGLPRAWRAGISVEQLYAEIDKIKEITR